jgi:hypothetical protein
VSISNIGIDPGVTDTGYVGQKADSFTLSNTVAFQLSQVGVVSFPGFSPTTNIASPQSTIDGSQPIVITVFDTTSAHPLVCNVDYTLTPVGSGSQLTYSILRVSTSTQSSNNDTCTVTYLFGDLPDTTYQLGETVAQSQIALTTTFLSQQVGAYGGQLPGAPDTTGTSVAGIGAAIPGGSISDVIPWAGSGNLGGQTGTVGQHDYSALQGLLGLDPQLQYGWAPGSPDTNAVYGGGSPLAYSPLLANENQGNLGSTGDPGYPDTTIGGGSLYSGSGVFGQQTVSSPVYRAPILGVAGWSKDTTLTDILGNQISAAALTNAAYYAVNVDTNPWGTSPQGAPGGWQLAPSVPIGLSSQTDVFAAANSSTTVYLSQAGVIASSIVFTNTTQSNTMVLNTDYTLTVVGNGPDTYVSVNFLVAAHFANGNTVQAVYSYGTPQYFDSNIPASVPGAPLVGSTTQFTQTGISFTATPVALANTGIVTPPASFVVTDTTAGANIGKIQVMNLDYTVVPSGSGSTLTYTIARLAGSTNSTSGDTVSVVYNYGNAAYFQYGPCLPVNRGAQVNWGPPAGQTEVDYYLIQANPVNGTMYCPKSGEPGFYGQPSAASAAAGGQPVYQSDTISLTNGQIATPTGLAVTYTGTAGATTYAYRVTAINNNGTTLAEAEQTVGSAFATLSGSNHTNLTWNPVVGATSYGVYGRTSGAELFMTTVTTTSFTDTGTFTPSGALPAANTTQPAMSKSGIVTPPGQVIVRDLTSTAFTIAGSSPSDYLNEAPTGGQIVYGGSNIPAGADDMLQPGGTVLIYGVDYTITTFAVGPYLTMQINLVPSSVNANPGDTCAVDYWYDIMGDIPLTAANDTLVLVAGSAALLHSAIITAPQNVVFYDTTTSKPLAYGLDYTILTSGLGPTTTMTFTRISGGPANVGATDTIHAYYLYGSSLTAFFTQGLLENTPVIWHPNGTLYSWQGYNFSIAAGNRAGLGPFSSLSDYIVPLNYQAPQPGFQGTTQTITFRDPANSINPAYKPDGTFLSGTGLGV